MSSPARPSTDQVIADEYERSLRQREHGCFEPDCDDLVDEFSDPFEILAAKEEAAGVPLVYLTVDHHD